jgi:hypothetical protein
VLAALVSNKGQDSETQEVLRALIRASSTTPVQTVTGYRGLSNQEFREKADALSAKILGIDQAYKIALNSQVSVSGPMLLNATNEEGARWQPLRAETRIIIDEMLSRIPPDAAPKNDVALENVVSTVDYGSLARPSPLAHLSTYIDQLAALLPQTIKGKKK